MSDARPGHDRVRVVEGSHAPLFQDLSRRSRVLLRVDARVHAWVALAVGLDLAAQAAEYRVRHASSVWGAAKILADAKERAQCPKLKMRA
jgi:hypothetical protein